MYEKTKPLVAPAVAAGPTVNKPAALSVTSAPETLVRDLRVQTVSATRDEAFLSDLDVSLSRAAVPELRALDAFTPRAGDRSR